MSLDDPKTAFILSQALPGGPKVRKHAFFQSVNRNPADRRAARPGGRRWRPGPARATSTWPRGGCTRRRRSGMRPWRIYEKALSEDPADMPTRWPPRRPASRPPRCTSISGLKLRGQGQLGDALLEFQKAYAHQSRSPPSRCRKSQRTQEMIQRERKRVEATGQEAPPEERALTPVEEYEEAGSRRRSTACCRFPSSSPLEPAEDRSEDERPEGQGHVRNLGKVAGINVLWDPEYQPPAQRQLQHRFRGLHHRAGAGLSWPCSPSPTGSRSRPTPSSSPRTTPTSAATTKSRSPRFSTCNNVQHAAGTAGNRQRRPHHRRHPARVPL